MTIRFTALAALAVFAAPLALGQTVLYKQPNGFETADDTPVNTNQGWIYSENFPEANDDIDSYLADDFTVPAGDIWTVTTVSVLAYYADDATYRENNPDGSGIVKATSFNVIVWADDAAAGTPGEEVLRLDEVAPTSDGTTEGGVTGIISFNLPTSLQLDEGTYWLTVQANMPTTDLSQGTRYFWGTNDAAFGEPLQFWNYGGGLTAFAPCDQGWGDNTPECRSNPNLDQDPTLYMRISGTFVTASEEVAQSGAVALEPTRPNPAAGRALVPFTLDRPADVRLAVYDALGREVAVVAEQAYGAGAHAEVLDTSALAPGTYVVRLVAGADVVLRTIAVAR